MSRYHGIEHPRGVCPENGGCAWCIEGEDEGEPCTKRVIDIVHVDDERVDYFLDGKDLVSVNHDEDGWGGMETVDQIIRRMAKEAGWTVREDEIALDD